VTKLSVNVNKIATLRNSRGGLEPNLMNLVHKIVDFGAHGITVHPRADQRHITRQDAVDVATQVKTVETNFEGDIREDFLDLTLKMKPTQCTLVPVNYGEVTSDHGWDVFKNDYILSSVIGKLKTEGIRVSLFIDAGNFKGIEKTAELGADRIEIYTEPYAIAYNQKDYEKEISLIKETVSFAQSVGLESNAGHDLTHKNLIPLLDKVPDIAEVSIGHHIMAYALEVGLEKSIKDHLDVIGKFN
jgi:pyridoxine 5-phosphate synthase